MSAKKSDIFLAVRRNCYYITPEPIISVQVSGWRDDWACAEVAFRGMYQAANWPGVMQLYGLVLGSYNKDPKLSSMKIVLMNVNDSQIV